MARIVQLRGKGSVTSSVDAGRIDVGSTARSGREGWRLAVTVAVGAACASLFVLVGLEGSLVWRLVRVAAVILAGAAVLAVRDGPQGARTLAVTSLGVVAFAAGAGIGVPHVMAGAWLTGVAGLVALVSGTTLLLLAARASWANASGWRRVLVVVIGVALVHWVLFSVSTAVFATNRAPMPLPDRTPAEVGLGYSDVTLTTQDGVELAAWYVPSANGAAIVLLHGSGSTRVSVLEHAEVLADAGFGVLLLDARGHGESGGYAMDLGWHGDADVAAAIAFLEGRPDVTAGIGAVGMSMGGEEAIGALASVPALDAVVAEGATGRSGADRLPLQAGLGRVTSGAFYAVQDATATLLSGVPPPTDLRTAIIEAHARPVLLIAGGAVPQESEAGRRLQRAAPDRVELWELPEVGHTGGLAAVPERWAAKVTAFLEDALLD